MHKPNPSSYITLVTVVLFIGGCAPVAYAQKAKTSETREWLQFRGPNGTGVAEGFTLPAEFGPNKNLVWSTYSADRLLDFLELLYLQFFLKANPSNNRLPSPAMIG